jgi:hypothetical protein
MNKKVFLKQTIQNKVSNLCIALSYTILHTIAVCSLILSPLFINPAIASSHREAPFITELPKVDATDLYMFTSYEEGRSDYVTIIANYLPLQDSYGGPNYFAMDTEAFYDVNIDNTGDAKEDLTFRFKFQQLTKNLSVKVGGKDIPVPLINIGAITTGNNANQNILETYTLSLIKNNSKNNKLKKGDRVVDAENGKWEFSKPIDNIGNKSIPNYEAYAASFIRKIKIPGCSKEGKVFVGQRKEPFVVNLGETFDLINYKDPIGPPSAEINDLADKNITSLALELPKTLYCWKRRDHNWSMDFSKPSKTSSTPKETWVCKARKNIKT